MSTDASPRTPEHAVSGIFDGPSAAVYDAVFDLYGTLSRDGSVRTISGRIFARTGMNPTLLTGQIFSQTVFWQSSENTPKILEKAIGRAANGESERITLDFRVNADEKLPFEVQIVPIGGPDAETLFICGRSIPAKQRPGPTVSVESEHLLFAAENADIGLWFWDFNDNRIYSTPRCNELFEVPAYEELTFDRVLQAVHPGDRDAVRTFVASSRENGTKYEEEFRVLYSDGTVDWICTEGKSIVDANGTPQRMMGVVRKITEQKLAGEELQRVNDLVKKARDEAVEANRAKDFFLAFVSHEIRSSLNAIIGWSRILLTKEVDDATRKSALETIERSARTQTKLINDLVDSARVASGKLRLEYQQIDICEVVRGSYEAHRPSAETAKINYKFESDVEKLTIVGDSARLQQVFGNLISNALKFTPQGGEISISIKTGAEAVTVDVRDNGRGISPENLPKVFRQFSQADNDSPGGNLGLGLGLSIVKILVERHGGHVRAESPGLGKGSLFSVTLPITATTPAPDRPGSNPVAGSNKPLDGLSILVVEDNDDSREVLQMFLEKSGAKVAAAESARVAFEILNGPGRIVPDLMISDLAMPDEDGYSLVARIRADGNPDIRALPAIALSAFANDESRRKAHESGFHRYATKPFDHDLIITEILDVLDKYGRGPDTDKPVREKTEED
jgi:PAS domain S-box-containing protein